MCLVRFLQTSVCLYHLVVFFLRAGRWSCVRDFLPNTMPIIWWVSSLTIFSFVFSVSYPLRLWFMHSDAWIWKYLGWCTLQWFPRAADQKSETSVRNLRFADFRSLLYDYWRNLWTAAIPELVGGMMETRCLSFGGLPFLEMSRWKLRLA